MPRHTLPGAGPQSGSEPAKRPREPLQTEQRARKEQKCLQRDPERQRLPARKERTTTADPEKQAAPKEVPRHTRRGCVQCPTRHQRGQTTQEERDLRGRRLCSSSIRNGTSSLITGVACCRTNRRTLCLSRNATSRVANCSCVRLPSPANNKRCSASLYRVPWPLCAPPALRLEEENAVRRRPADLSTHVHARKRAFQPMCFFQMRARASLAAPCDTGPHDAPWPVQ